MVELPVHLPDKRAHIHFLVTMWRQCSHTLLPNLNLISCVHLTLSRLGLCFTMEITHHCNFVRLSVSLLLVCKSVNTSACLALDASVCITVYICQYLSGCLVMNLPGCLNVSLHLFVCVSADLSDLIHKLSGLPLHFYLSACLHALLCLLY